MLVERWTGFWQAFFAGNGDEVQLVMQVVTVFYVKDFNCMVDSLFEELSEITRVEKMQRVMF